MSYFPQPICETVWEQKYKFQTKRTDVQSDKDVFDTWDRIASACAASPRYKTATDSLSAHQRFMSVLTDFKFSPAGRIIAGAGTGRNVTLFNCFVMGTIPDSLDGIFEMLKEAALTMQQGGGIGYDFSPIRPSTAFVKGVEAEASGPLSFMDVWDSMCRTIMSAGGRRGAMMATMRCDHPDVMDFITAKREVGRLNQFNMSVLVTDQLMDAVHVGGVVPLVHKEPPMEPNAYGTNKKGEYIYGYIDARELWNAIMAETYHHAEPGVIFIDRINKENNLWFAEEIMATNPCGEQPLPPYGACLLGSINLTKFVVDPFTQSCGFSWKALEETMKIAVEMTDCVIDASNFPLELQREEAIYKRRMGLGVTGLADAMFMLGIRYGSPESEEFTSAVLKAMAIAGYETSMELAKAYGPAPVFEDPASRRLALSKGMIRKLPETLKGDIEEHGLRNSHILSIAPTGTMSLYMGNVSSGVEPNFADSYVRKVLQKDMSKTEETVYASAILEYNKIYEAAESLEEIARLESWKEMYWCTAQDLEPVDHVNVQAAAQKWVDSSISKTVNLPEDITIEDFSNVYLDAYEKGCKGCTTYRPNDILGSVLSVEKKEENPATEVANDGVDEGPQPPEEETYAGDLRVMTRPKVMEGSTYKLRWGRDSYYLTINDVKDPEDDWMMPFEIFTNSKNVEHDAWTAALTRMVSAVFQRGGDVRFVAEELKQIHDPKGGQWVDGKYVPSLVALIGMTIEEHLKTMFYRETLSDGEILLKEFSGWMDEIPEQEETQPPATETPMQCPSCKGYNVHVVSGCPTCGDCGYSKCG